MITYMLNFGKTRCHPKVWKFPAGEVGVQVQNHAHPEHVEEVSIRASIISSDEVMQLFMLTDALRRKFFNAKLNVVFGYLPYGRQDRVCNEGDSLSVAVFAQLVNSQNYDHVEIIDPHSDVASALFKNLVVMSQLEVYKLYFDHMFGWDANAILVAPDAGAAKKAAAIAAVGKFDDVLYAVKSRNLQTGAITSLTLSGNVEGKDVVVIDDICDGGATFIELGNLLREKGAKSLKLIITHGIFSKGTKVLTDIYDSVYTTNSYHQDRVGLVDGIEYIKII
jgi:ribose-phosphate pyrophosphokinase